MIERELAKAELLLAKKPAPPKRTAVRTQAAVAAAIHLLLLQGEDQARRGFVTQKWEPLAKALAGDGYVIEHIRAFKRRKLVVAMGKETSSGGNLDLFVC